MHLYLTVPALESVHPHNRFIMHQANLNHTRTTLCRCSWTSHPATVCVQAPIRLLDQVFWYLMVQWLIWILLFAAWMSLPMAIWTKCPYRMPSQAKKKKRKKTCPTYNEKSENGSVHDSSWYGCMEKDEGRQRCSPFHPYSHHRYIVRCEEAGLLLLNLLCLLSRSSFFCLGLLIFCMALGSPQCVHKLDEVSVSYQYPISEIRSASNLVFIVAGSWICVKY